MKQKMPIVALRDMTVLPSMVIHFDINREMTMQAIEAAMLDEQTILLLTQKNAEEEEPKKSDLYEIGTIALIKQLVRLPGNILRVMVEGLQAARLISLEEEVSHLFGKVEILEKEEELTDIEKTAILQNMKEILEIYASENPKLSKSVLKQLMETNDPDTLTNLILAHIPFTLEDKQELLEVWQKKEKFIKLSALLSQIVELYHIKKEFQVKVKEKVDKNQREYILREQLKVIREELGESNTIGEAQSYLEAVEELKASNQVKDKIKKEIERFKGNAGSSAENTVSRAYIETLLELPWDKISKDNKDLKNAEIILNEDHYGLEKVKERILEFLAVRNLTKKGDAPIICLVGPPGTGKTSIAKSVARALNKKYIRISLGGVRDEAEIRGHRRTYVGAMPGRIITGLKNAAVKNPLMLLDEIDKVSSDYRGETSSALLEVLDSEQNNRFIDHYIEIPVDLSEVLFIATANSVQTIPRPLLDRMELIEVSSYTLNEKMHIAKEHLINKQKQKNGIKKGQLTISDNALEKIITGYTKEAGVRNLERKIGEICRKAARKITENKKEAVKVTEKNLEKFLGKIKYTIVPANEQPEIGIVRGLAWTSVGGDTLQIEVNLMPGKGKFELTGQLGDIMKESARAGISYIRSISEKYEIEREFYEKNDIHIHIPEGAVPKDGPSAGITMATAMFSAITKQKVRSDLAMTGEITLRGRVLPIGGLKEKLLAAKTAGIKIVLVPKKNEPDITELSKEIKDGLSIQFVETMEEVLNYALIQG